MVLQVHDRLREHRDVGARRDPLVRGNEDLRIIDNRLEARRAGVAQGSGALPDGSQPQPNLRALIQGNTITGQGASAGIGLGRRALQDSHSHILDNVVMGLDGEGIALIDGNTHNVVRGNTVTDNGRNGISAGARGHRQHLRGQREMLGNGRIDGTGGVDARDGNPLVDGMLQNAWINNVCDTDIPAGMICGVGVAALDG